MNPRTPIPGPQIAALSVRDLRKELDGRGLGTSGSRTEMEARLLPALAVERGLQVRTCGV